MSIRTALPAIVATLGLAVFATACSSSDKRDSTTAAPVTAAATTVAPAAATASTTPADTGDTAAAGDATGGTGVAIAGFKFGPAEIDVKVGDTVTWTNNDKQAHTATSSGTFDTGSIAPGATATATFDTAGIFAYICSFHPFMKGTVVVS